jgi:hypothetical protein
LATKKLSQIVDEKSRLFNLGLSREVFSSWICYNIKKHRSFIWKIYF